MTSHIVERERFLGRVKKRFLLRGHMTFIISATGLSGVGTNWVLFHLGYTSLWVRYPIAVLGAYLIFLLLVRLWLSYATRRESLLLDALDVVDIPTGGGGSGAGDVIRGGGGRFGGGGASSSFESTSMRVAPLTGGGRSSGGVSGGGGGGIDIDGDGLIVLLVFAVLVLAVIFAGGYLIWDAPTILAETLFEFSLASALLGKLRRTERADWIGQLVRLTWKPFVAVFLLAAVFSGVAHQLRPDAHRLVDLLHEPVPR